MWKIVEKLDPREPSAVFALAIPILLALISAFSGPEIFRPQFSVDPTKGALLLIGHFVFWMIIAAGIVKLADVQRKRRRARCIKALRAARTAATQEPRLQLPAQESVYALMDDDERDVLKVFIDRGVAELAYSDLFPGSGSEEERGSALIRLEQRSYIHHRVPSYNRRAERYILLRKHFEYLSAHPGDVGSNQPIRLVAS